MQPIADDIGVKGLKARKVDAVDVELPYQFKPRWYQTPVLHNLFVEMKRRILLVWHRRAGKDKTVFNTITMAAMVQPGLYLYMLPTQKQAKKVIWQGRGKDGLKFTDHIPKEIIKKVNNTEMFIELVNGSIIQLGGSDNFDSFMGTNPLGIVFSEYSLQNPRAWDFFRPILAENGGWAIFDYTFRGRNHGYKLYETNRKNPNWYVSLLTVDDTYIELEDGTRVPVITEEAIQEERDSGMDEDMIQQEFYCSPDAAVKGAVFGEKMRDAHKEQRICKIPIDPNLEVHTFWDLGISTGNAMCVWFMQQYGKEYRFIHYYEAEGKDIEHFFQYCDAFKEKHGIKWGIHHYPHDMINKELFGKGRTRLEIAKEMGYPGKIVPRCTSKNDSIQATRKMMPYCYWDVDECEQGLNCLMAYQYKYYEELDYYSKDPLHNWASNGADAFQGFGQSFTPPKPKSEKKKPKSPRSWRTQRDGNTGWMAG